MIWVFRSLLAVLFLLPPTVFALAVSVSMSMAGFPDGHITAYDKAMVLPNNVLIGTSICVGIYLVYRAFRVARARDVFSMAITLCLYFVIVGAAGYGVDWYLKDYLGLDYGQGG